MVIGNHQPYPAKPAFRQPLEQISPGLLPSPTRRLHRQHSLAALINSCNFAGGDSLQAQSPEQLFLFLGRSPVALEDLGEEGPSYSTRGGVVVNFLKGATPLDFAYRRDLNPGVLAGALPLPARGTLAIASGQALGHTPDIFSVAAFTPSWMHRLISSLVNFGQLASPSSSPAIS